MLNIQFEINSFFIYFICLFVAAEQQDYPKECQNALRKLASVLNVAIGSTGDNINHVLSLAFDWNDILSNRNTNSATTANHSLIDLSFDSTPSSANVNNPTTPPTPPATMSMTTATPTMSVSLAAASRSVRALLRIRLPRTAVKNKERDFN